MQRFSCSAMQLLCGLLLLCLITSEHAAPANKKTNFNNYFLEAMAAYKRLEQRVPRKELQQLTTIGLLDGAQRVEAEMEQNLVTVVKDLLLNTNMNNTQSVLPKIDGIEQQLKRDESALRILSSSMDLAMKQKSLKAYKKEMQRILKENKESQEKARQGLLNSNSTSNVIEQELLAERIGALRQHILQQVDLMKTMVNDKVSQTLNYLLEHADDQSLLAKANKKTKHKRQVHKEHPAVVRQIKSILTEDDFRQNLVDNDTASASDKPELFELNEGSKQLNSNETQNKSMENINGSSENSTLAKQELESDELDVPMPADGGGGGLVGLIASLSGGEGGSDVGALIGALSGVIANLFGPGGLDLEVLISTGTSLISGLLSGTKNFGTVLGGYIGLAVDGLSGGGGAINNGQFFGNFLGTIVASLSADPEEDNVPPKPFVFLKNFVDSFIEAKNRPDDEEEEEARGDGAKQSKRQDASAATSAAGGDKGSDSGAFVKQIAAHITSSLVGLVLNAVVGASGGSSQASSSLFTSSSSGSSQHPPAQH